MINVTNIVSEFRRADLQAYINEYAAGELLFKQYFPSTYTPKLTYEALEAEFGAKVAADVVGFDSRAPRKGRSTIGKSSGDIPKIEIARTKTETDLNTYRQLQQIAQSSNPAVAVQVKKKLIDWIYEDATFVLNGVNARMEWLAKQIASNGKYKLNITNNAGGVVTVVDVDFKIPTANRKDASVNWFSGNPANYKPITDIKAVTTAARVKGVILKYAFTDQETFDKMVASDEVQKYCASFVNNVLSLQQVPNILTVNTALRNGGLPEFIIWDSYINVESKTGALTAVSGWEQGNVTFSPTSQIGESQWTDTAESFVNLDKDSTKAYNDFVLVKSFAEQDPISVVTKGVAYATPVMQNRNGIYILKTKTA